MALGSRLFTSAKCRAAVLKIARPTSAAHDAIALVVKVRSSAGSHSIVWIIPVVTPFKYVAVHPRYPPRIPPARCDGRQAVWHVASFGTVAPAICSLGTCTARILPLRLRWQPHALSGHLAKGLNKGKAIPKRHIHNWQLSASYARGIPNHDPLPLELRNWESANPEIAVYCDGMPHLVGVAPCLVTAASHVEAPGSAKHKVKQNAVRQCKHHLFQLHYAMGVCRTRQGIPCRDALSCPTRTRLLVRLHWNASEREPL